MRGYENNNNAIHTNSQMIKMKTKHTWIINRILWYACVLFLRFNVFCCYCCCCCSKSVSLFLILCLFFSLLLHFSSVSSFVCLVSYILRSCECDTRTHTPIQTPSLFGQSEFFITFQMKYKSMLLFHTWCMYTVYYVTLAVSSSWLLCWLVIAIEIISLARISGNFPLSRKENLMKPRSKSNSIFLFSSDCRFSSVDRFMVNIWAFWSLRNVRNGRKKVGRPANQVGQLRSNLNH